MHGGRVVADGLDGPGPLGKGDGPSAASKMTEAQAHGLHQWVENGGGLVALQQGLSAVANKPQGELREQG